MRVLRLMVVSWFQQRLRVLEFAQVTVVVRSREGGDLGRARVVAIGGGRSGSGSLVVLCNGLLPVVLGGVDRTKFYLN